MLNNVDTMSAEKQMQMMMLPIDVNRGMFAKRNGAINTEIVLNGAAEEKKTMQLPMYTKAASIASDNFEDVQRYAHDLMDGGIGENLY